MKLSLKDKINTVMSTILDHILTYFAQGNHCTDNFFGL